MLASAIRPTGTCFDDALDFITEILNSSSGDAKVRWIEQLILVHAICLSPYGQKYAHAWVEHNQHIWQGGVYLGHRVFYAQQRDRFYEEYRVIESTRYSVTDALHLNALHDNYGPWEQRYRELALARD